MEKHNGYSNYETWTVASVIANTSNLYIFFKNLATDLINNSENRFNVKKTLIQHIKVKVIDLAPKGNNPIWDPIINNIHTEVINYSEIADSILEEIPIKTIKMDFFEKFPDASVDINGIPDTCAKQLGYKVECGTGDCYKCWTTPLEVE